MTDDEILRVIPPDWLDEVKPELEAHQ